MTTINIKTERKDKENWVFIYSVFGSALAMLPLMIRFLDIAWPYKITAFYLGFLAVSYLTLLNPRSRGWLSRLSHYIYLFRGV